MLLLKERSEKLHIAIVHMATARGLFPLAQTFSTTFTFPLPHYILYIAKIGRSSAQCDFTRLFTFAEVLGCPDSLDLHTAIV